MSEIAGKMLLFFGVSSLLGWIMLFTGISSRREQRRREEYERTRATGRIVDYVREKSPKAFIVWDPIASASAGYHFMRGIEQDDFLPIMSSIAWQSCRRCLWSINSFERFGSLPRYRFSAIVSSGT